MHFILPDVINMLRKNLGPQASFDLQNLRQAIDREGASINHSSVFDGAQRRCVKIPRSIADRDVLVVIDAGMKT